MIQFNVPNKESFDSAKASEVRQELATLIDLLLKDSQNGHWVAAKQQQLKISFKCQVKDANAAKVCLSTGLKNHWMHAFLEKIETA